MLRRFTARFYTDLNKQQLQDKLKSGTLLIDVRNHDGSFALRHSEDID